MLHESCAKVEVGLRGCRLRRNKERENVTGESSQSGVERLVARGARCRYMGRGQPCSRGQRKGRPWAMAGRGASRLSKLWLACGLASAWVLMRVRAQRRLGARQGRTSFAGVVQQARKPASAALHALVGEACHGLLGYIGPRSRAALKLIGRAR